MKKETHVPEWMLERYLLNELPRKKLRQLEKELEQDPALRAALEKLRLSDRQILNAYPSERMVPEILKKASPAKREPIAPSRWRLAWMAAPAMALAVFLLVILPPLVRQRPAVSENSDPEDYIGTKGSGTFNVPGLQIYRKKGDVRQALHNGDAARAGELLQVAYVPAGQTNGVILSIDGAGAVTLHFPEKTDGDTLLQSGRRAFLPNAFALDQAPRFERFFFITAKEPLPTAAILEKARRLASDRNKAETGLLDLSRRFGQYSLLVRK